MKKPVAIFILVTLLFNGAGFYVYYALQLKQIRIEMRAALKFIPENKLEVLKLTRTTFTLFKKEENEILFEGEMFDIARVICKNDSVFVYCLRDEKENNLIALLDYFVTTPLQRKNSIPAAIQQFITLSFVVPLNEITFEIATHCTSDLTPYNFNSKIFTASVEGPPPKSIT